jgi:hypothetical protein
MPNSVIKKIKPRCLRICTNIYNDKSYSLKVALRERNFQNMMTVKLDKYFFCVVFLAMAMLQSVVAQEASAIVARQASTITARYASTAPPRQLSSVLVNFCTPVTTINAFPLRQSREIDAPSLRLVQKNGLAALAGAQENDQIVKLGNADVSQLTTREFHEKHWKSSLETASKTGVALQVTVRRVVDEKPTELQLIIPVSSECPELMSGLNDAANAELQQTASKIEGLSAENLLLMRVVRNMAFRHTDLQSTGRRMSVLGSGPNRDAAGVCRSLNDLGAKPLVVTGCTYTANDFLKADVLAMLILRAGQIPLDHFIAWRKFESKAIYGIFKMRFEYDEKEIETLKAVELSLKSADIRKAASLVDLEITPHESKALLRSASLAHNLPANSGVGAVGAVANDNPPVLNHEFRKAYAPSLYAKLADVAAVPYLTSTCRDRYAAWIKRSNPKGFAVSDKGGCAASVGMSPPEPGLPIDPAERALHVCAKDGARKCQLYAVDDDVVWKAQ